MFIDLYLHLWNKANLIMINGLFDMHSRVYWEACMLIREVEVYFPLLWECFSGFNVTVMLTMQKENESILFSFVSQGKIWETFAFSSLKVWKKSTMKWYKQAFVSVERLYYSCFKLIAWYGFVYTVCLIFILHCYVIEI